MPISRRKFVQTATLVAISAGLPIKVLASDSSSVSSLSGLAGSTSTRSLIGSEVFAQYVNTQFAFKRGEIESKFVLKEVRHWAARSTKKSSGGKECFSLVFDRVAGNEQLIQDTYTAVHSSLGEFPLFVGPAGKSQRKYEALFNRLHG